jgi:hypothetical protein
VYSRPYRSTHVYYPNFTPVWKMARQVRDSRLETREARLRLPRRDEPYWRLIHEGLHLGYRKRARGGVWVVRIYKDGKYSKCNLGRADDLEKPNGETVLSFKQASARPLSESTSLSKHSRWQTPCEGISVGTRHTARH